MHAVVLLALLLVVGCSGAAPHHAGMVAAAQVAGDETGIERKVIETVHLEIRVDSVDVVAGKLPAAVAEVKGYVAESHLMQSQHLGEWTVRVPNAELPRFIIIAKSWGVLLSERATAEDVTEQFIDVTARLSAKRMEEDRLLKLLADGTGNLTDVLAVEKELQRVRQEIEQAQGRVKYLEHATSFATVHLRARELLGVGWSDGQPLTAQMGATFRSSVNVLLLMGRGLILVGTALLPWCLVAGIPLIMLLRLIGRRGRKHPSAGTR